MDRDRSLLVAALHALASVRSTVPLLIALMIGVVASGTGCAHRTTSTGASAMLNPSSPARDVDRSDHAQRAGQTFDRLRRSTQDGKSAPVESLTELRPTDNTAPLAQPTGTSWSVVVGSAPSAPVKTDATTRQQSPASATNAPDPKRPSPWQRRLDIIGGSIGALCAVLALRKRARESSVGRNDLAA